MTPRGKQLIELNENSAKEIKQGFKKEIKY